jgi:hypothetical protein
LQSQIRALEISRRPEYLAVTFKEFNRRKETMGDRPAGYWVVVIVAVGCIVASYMMRSSPDPRIHEASKYLGYGAIVLLIAARFIFPRKIDTTPPMPKD